MDNILYVLLLVVLRIANSEDISKEDNSNSTETDSTFAAEIETDVFTLDPDLRELHMDGCSWLAIFEVTPNLHSLDILNCSWYIINITQFSAVPNLSTLRMRGGKLVKLNSNQFVELPHLEVLELGSNRIERVYDDTFKGLSQLWMLTLNDNNLAKLPENLFSPLPELRHLDLNNNRIDGLPVGIFANNPKLLVFCLRRGFFLTFSPNILTPVMNLIFLDLSNNHFRNLQLPSAESIRLENSGVHNLKIYGRVSKLQARDNLLKSLYIGKEDAVTELDLHGNILDSGDISGFLRRMWRLQILDISKNVLRELPIFTKDNFAEVFILPSLRFVNMSKNLLNHLRGYSPVLSPSLTHLDLSYNKIRSIEPHTFSMSSKLESLYIQGNLLVNFQFEVFHQQQRGLKEVALYNNEFHQDTYEKITEYFANAGVLVLEDPDSKVNTSKLDTFHARMLIRRRNPKKKRYEPARQQYAEQNIFNKWSTWNLLIFLIVLAALTFNAILILQRLHATGKMAWRRRHASKIKASFQNREAY